MTMTIHKSGSVVHASLSGDLTVVEVAALHEQLMSELDSEGTLVVDAAEVTRIDTSIAQLFLFASHIVRTVRVDSPSPAWKSAMTALGLRLDSVAQ